MQEKQIYLNTPAGDLILVEIVQKNNTTSILIGDDYCLDLDLQSALDLADEILMITSDERENLT